MKIDVAVSATLDTVDVTASTAPPTTLRTADFFGALADFEGAFAALLAAAGFFDLAGAGALALLTALPFEADFAGAAFAGADLALTGADFFGAAFLAAALLSFALDALAADLALAAGFAAAFAPDLDLELAAFFAMRCPSKNDLTTPINVCLPISFQKPCIP